MMYLHLLLVCAVGLVAVGTVSGQTAVYEITFEDYTTVAEVDAVIEQLENEYGVTIINNYRFDIFSVLTVSANANVIPSIRDLNKVECVEKDGNADATCTQIDSPGTWGLDRIDQREELICYDALNDFAEYLLGPYKGAGVTAYIVDTGIDVTHPDFEGRATWGYTAAGISGNTDDNGHGTHVAGTVGSKNYGVAKDVDLVAVKVLGSNALGTYATIIDGLAWIYNDLVARDDASVVTLTWSAPKHVGVNKVILSLVRKKAVIVAAAGNNGGEACLRTPASAPATTTVASMNIFDKASVFSNWGGCVHLFAPGLNIKSTWLGGSTKIMSGTSMAAAHVAGVAALKLSKEDRTSGQMRAWFGRKAWRDILEYPNDDQKKTPNRVLFLDCELENKRTRQGP